MDNVRRVPLDFDWPLNKTWEGFIRPVEFSETKCPDCKGGYSPHAKNLHDLWYGHIPFDPSTTGSVPFTHDSPEVRRRAEQNVAQAPDYCGNEEEAIIQEGRRLAGLFNSKWMHHLSQDDVDVLAEANRLVDFTHTWTPEVGGRRNEPFITPDAAHVNSWSLTGYGHDGLNAWMVIRARCEREGIEENCRTCQGNSTIETYPGQRAEGDKWRPAEPPKGEGWQLWRNTPGGFPLSPVYASPDELAAWMSDPARGRSRTPPEVARKFVAIWVKSTQGND